MPIRLKDALTPNIDRRIGQEESAAEESMKKIKKEIESLNKELSLLEGSRLKYNMPFKAKLKKEKKKRHD